MLASGIPIKFNIPFANNAGVGYIRAVPQASQIGVTAGAASLTDGFPPVCSLPVGSGGTPPWGQDFNGILNQITAWNRWQQAGGPIQYDAAFATGIGGYPKGAILLSTTTTGLLWLSTADNNTTNPDGASPANWTKLFQPALTASATYFVNASTGSDSNDGLSSGTAFLTLQKAANVVTGFNLNNHNVTINVATGTYSTVNLPTINGSGTVTFVGNAGTPANVIITNNAGSAINAGNTGSTWAFNGFTLTSSGSSSSDPGCAINVNGLSTITMNNIVFGTCQGGHMSVVNGANLTLGGTLTITGGLTANALMNGIHMYAGGSSIIQTVGWVNNVSRPSLTISNAVSLPYFLVVSANALGEILYSSITNPGNVTGQRYLVNTNGVVNTNGAGATYYPGTIAGATATGGQYV